MDALMGHEPVERLQAACTDLQDTYSARVRDRKWLREAECMVGKAQLGIAAYALGVHYTVHDWMEQAEYWLRIAASHDVGDADLRMAHLCEIREAVRIGSSGE